VTRGCSGELILVVNMGAIGCAGPQNIGYLIGSEMQCSDEIACRHGKLKHRSDLSSYART